MFSSSLAFSLMIGLNFYFSNNAFLSLFWRNNKISYLRSFLQFKKFKQKPCKQIPDLNHFLFGKLFRIVQVQMAQI